MSKTKLFGYILMAVGGVLSLGSSILLAKAGEEDTAKAVNEYISEHKNDFVLEAKG